MDDADFKKKKDRMAAKLLEYLLRYPDDPGVRRLDKRINKISRARIRLAKSRGEVWLGKIDRSGTDKSKPYLVKYEKGMVKDFEYTFLIPCFDQALIDLIREREGAPFTGLSDDLKRLTAIFARIEELGGQYLHWA